jgi:hypothetical protein
MERTQKKKSEEEEGKGKLEENKYSKEGFTQEGLSRRADKEDGKIKNNKNDNRNPESCPVRPLACGL